MKKFLVFFWALCITMTIQAQSSRKKFKAGQNNAFYRNDTSYYVGIKIISGTDKKNARFCQVKRGDSIEKLSPQEITSYGLNNEQVYIARNIETNKQTERVFLLRLHEGSKSLYYYKDASGRIFFLEKDSTQLLPITKKNADNESFRKQLLQLTDDCPEIADAVKVSNYNKGSLTKLIRNYEDCEYKPLPHFRFGIIGGFNQASLVPVKDYDNLINGFDTQYHLSYTAGVFLNTPVFVSNVSVQTELMYTQHEFSYSQQEDSTDYHLKAAYKNISVPILVRYTSPFKRFRPFIELGLIAHYNTKIQSNVSAQLLTEENAPIIPIDYPSVVHPFYVGYGMGAGLEIQITNRNSLILNVRRRGQFYLNNADKVNTSGWTYTLGINL